jgi:hypothetical protein
MLRNVKDLRGYSLRATDGVIGRVADFYFDDEDWGIRYLVVNTGSWLSDRKVLISPIAVGHAGWMAKRLPVALTRAQVEGSPDIDTRKPVSRQHEAECWSEAKVSVDLTRQAVMDLPLYESIAQLQSTW